MNTHNPSNKFTREITISECECISPKLHRLRFDGGTSGEYVVDYCERCFSGDDKKFLIKEEVLKIK